MAICLGIGGVDRYVHNVVCGVAGVTRTITGVYTGINGVSKSVDFAEGQSIQIDAIFSSEKVYLDGIAVKNRIKMTSSIGEIILSRDSTYLSSGLYPIAQQEIHLCNQGIPYFGVVIIHIEGTFGSITEGISFGEKSVTVPGAISHIWFEVYQ